MKFIRLLSLFVLLIPAAVAQDSASTQLTKGALHFGVWMGGGSGLAAASSYKFFNAGVRVGKVLTGQIGSSWARGNFEFAGDFMPVYLVWQDEFRVLSTGQLTGPGSELPPGTFVKQRRRIYGWSFSPVVLKWNFTRGRRLAPYVEAAGGVLFTNREVPAGNTSRVNFTPGGGLGVHIFTGKKQALTIAGQLLHVSNASMGDHNPGINAVLQLRVEYSRFK
jgi:hypothetical protein